MKNFNYIIIACK